MRQTRKTNNKALRYVPVSAARTNAERDRIITVKLRRFQKLVESGLIDTTTPEFKHLVALMERLAGGGI